MNRAAARVRHLAGRLVGWGFETAGGPPPGLAPRAGGDAGPVRPVVVVLLLGAEADAVAGTAADLAAAAAAGGSRPLLVIDRPHFAVARRLGVAVDHVLAAQVWADRGHPEPWDDHLARELGRLRHDLRTDHVVRLPPTGTAGLDPAGLRDVLRLPHPPGRLRSGWWRLTAALERRIDRGAG